MAEDAHAPGRSSTKEWLTIGECCVGTEQRLSCSACRGDAQVVAQLVWAHLLPTAPGGQGNLQALQTHQVRTG